MYRVDHLSRPKNHVEPRRNSLTNSYVKNDVAMLGATLTVLVNGRSAAPPKTK